MKIKKMPQKIAKYCRIFVSKVQEARMGDISGSILIATFILTLAIASTCASIYILEDVVFPQSTYSIETKEKIPYIFTVETENGSYPLKYVDLLKGREYWYQCYNLTAGFAMLWEEPWYMEIGENGPYFEDYYYLEVEWGVVELYKYIDLIPPDTEFLRFTMFLVSLNGSGLLNITFNNRVVTTLEIVAGKEYSINLNLTSSQINPLNISSGLKLSLIVKNLSSQPLLIKMFGDSLKIFPKAGKMFFPVNFTFLDIHGFKGPKKIVRDYFVEIYHIDIEGVRLDDNKKLSFSIPYERNGEKVFLSNGTYQLSFKLHLWDNRTFTLGTFSLTVGENGVKTVKINLPIYHLTIKAEYIYGAIAPIDWVYIGDSNHLIYSFGGEVYRKDYQTILNECFFPLPPGNYSIKIYSFDSFSNWIICEANFTINNSDATFVAKFYAIKIFQTACNIPLLLNLCLTLGYLAATFTYFIKKYYEKIVSKVRIHRRPLLLSIILSTTSIITPWTKSLDYHGNKIFYYFPILLETRELISLELKVLRSTVNSFSFLFVTIVFWIPFFIFLYQYFKSELRSSAKQIIGASILMLIAPILCTVSMFLIPNIVVSLELGCFLQLLSAFFGFIDALFVKKIKTIFTVAMKPDVKSQ